MSGLLPVFSGEAVRAAVPPLRAYDAVRDAFVRHAHGEWTMQPKVYVTNYPAGDFRAMPALGAGHALLKWVTSFPGNPARGLPTVTGLVLLSDASNGMLKAALDATLAHTSRREAFGGPLKDLQTVAHQVAEMALRTEAARLMVYAAAAAYDEGAPDVPKRAAMAKLLATETAQYVVDAAVQLHGARALRRGHLLEHLYREVRAPRIYEGASEVQRAVIAKELYRPAGPAGTPPPGNAREHRPHSGAEGESEAP